MFSTEIVNVREIRIFEAATKIPHSGADVLGVINLRGTVVPILDLSVRLGFPQSTMTSKSVMIITSSQDRLLGFLVDEVLDIESIPASHIQSYPDEAAGVGSHMISGIAVLDNRTLRILGASALALPSSEERYPH